jgi:hypothetical protein
MDVQSDAEVPEPDRHTLLAGAGKSGLTVGRQTPMRL